ncbi:BrnA antitoxin family protein [Streptomyces phytophilus]|uniref:BrnA antitoxin family protein n=1 Tax=Streptomyces phytophilus TaxID=722715 RepID=UPI00215D80D8|nr:BrnA antitoxin family protein [Streptomyces phytophilus]
MGTHVLSLRIEGNLLDRLRTHAAKRDMPVQDYVLQLLQRNDFDERFQAAVEETDRLTHWPTTATTPAPASAKPWQVGAPRK